MSFRREEETLVRNFFGEVLAEAQKQHLTPGILLVSGEWSWQRIAGLPVANPPKAELLGINGPSSREVGPADFGLHGKPIAVSPGLEECIFEKMGFFTRSGWARMQIDRGVKVALHTPQTGYREIMEVYSITVKPIPRASLGRKRDPLLISVYDVPQATASFATGCCFVTEAVSQRPEVVDILQALSAGGLHRDSQSLGKPALWKLVKGTGAMVEGIDKLFTAAQNGQLDPRILAYAAQCVNGFLWNLGSDGAVRDSGGGGGETKRLLACLERWYDAK